MARAKRKRIFREYLNPHFGYFYSIKRSLHKGRSKFQKIELVETEEFGTTLLLDDVTQVVEKNDYQYHEPMVHPAMCCHPGPRDVLVIGGGDGGILREVLKYHSVRSVAFAELDAEVVNFSRKYLASINKGAFDDRRVSTHFTDGRAFVEQNPGRFDVVIMDMTDPFGPSKMLYTREFFRAVKRSFRNRNGIFTMHSESPVVRPVAYDCILRTLNAVFNHVNSYYLYIQMYATYWSVAVSSDAVDVARTSVSSVDSRLRNRRIRGLKVFNGTTHRAMLARFPYIQDISRGHGRVITDRVPDFPDNIHHSA